MATHLKTLLLLAALLVGCGPQTPHDGPVGSIVPSPQGPAGNCDAGAAVCGTYHANLKVNLGATDGGIVGHIQTANLATGDASPGSIPIVLDGDVIGFHSYPPTAIEIDSGTYGQLPPGRLVACTNGLTLVTIGGIVTCAYQPRGGISTDGGLDGGVLVQTGNTYTAESITSAIGLIAIDAGTKNQLPESRLVACGSQYQVLTEGASALGCGAVNLGQSAAVTGVLSTTNQSAQSMGQDVTGTTAVATVTQLQAGEVTVGSSTGTLTCVAGASACGETQATPTSDVATTPMTFTAESAFAGASSHVGSGGFVFNAGSGSTTNGTIGNAIFNFPTPTASGFVTPFGHLKIQAAGVDEVSMGYDANWGSVIFFGTPGTGNAAFYSGDNGGHVYQNAITEVGGIIGGSTFVYAGNSSGFMLGSSTFDLAGGTGILGIHAASVAPTGATTSAGNEAIWSDTKGIHFTNHSESAPYSSAIGWDASSLGDALWLNPSSTGNFTDATAVLTSNGGTITVLNSGLTGGFTVGGISGTTAGEWNAQALVCGAPTTAQSTGTGVFQFAPETSLPTSCDTALSACVYDNANTAAVSNGLVSMDHNKMRTTLAPQVSTLTGTGTSGVDVQALTDGQYIGFGKTTTSSATQILTVPFPTNGVCDIEFDCMGRVTTAGTGSTLGQSFTLQQTQAAIVTAGSSSSLGSSVTLATGNTITNAGTCVTPQCVGIVSGANYVVTATQEGTTTACGTIDWTLRVKMLCN